MMGETSGPFVASPSPSRARAYNNVHSLALDDYVTTALNQRSNPPAKSISCVPPILFGGHVQAFIITVSTAIGPVKAGKVRALAVTGATRSDVLPDVPAASEFLPGFEATAWNGIGAPKATPAAIIDTLSTNITAGFVDATLKARIMDVGGETVPIPSAEFASFILDETEKWAKVVKFSGAKVE